LSTQRCIKDFFTLESRKVFEGILQFQINITNRYYRNDPFSILIVQIENIKKHNETVQQVVKKKVADFLDHNSRASDVISILSHDKFILLSPCTNLEGATLFAKKLQKFAEDEKFEISFGVGEYDVEYEEESKEEYILRVNDMLSHVEKSDIRGTVL
jgi:diguanylate cyclase (GGDEF)-like protein